MSTFLGRALPVAAAVVTLACSALAGTGVVASNHYLSARPVPSYHCYGCRECPKGWVGCERRG
jgi:hypothetical protein